MDGCHFFPTSPCRLCHDTGVLTWQVNVEVIQALLASPTICKVCWDCKGTLQNLICQEHIAATQVQNVVDAQQMFSSDEENLGSLSQMIEDARNEMQQSGLKPECKKLSKGAVKNGAALCCDWTDEDWDRLQALLQPPDWDRFHAHNERAMRRPFSHSFLKHGAAVVLAMQAAPTHPNPETGQSLHLFKFHVFRKPLLQDSS